MIWRSSAALSMVSAFSAAGPVLLLVLLLLLSVLLMLSVLLLLLGC